MSAAASNTNASAGDETVDLAELLSVCVTLVSHAGAAIRRIFDSGNLGAVDKDASGGAAAAASAGEGSIPAQGRNTEFGSIVDPQTLADLESQRIIIGNLARLWPGLAIVGEEGELDNALSGEQQNLVQRGQTLASSETPFPEHLRKVPIKDLAVFVDPLDGTKEFTLGYVHYVTVLVGISLRGEALAGVVHVPFTGGSYPRKHDPLYEDAADQDALSSAASKDGSAPVGQTIWGAVGAGVHGITVPPASSVPADRRWITTTRTHMSPRLQSLLDELKPGRVIRCGGAGSKGLLVLARQADAYVYPQKGTKRWDTAAIDALIRAAGGQFTDGHGRAIVYDPHAPRFDNDAGILATMREDLHKLYTLPLPNADAGAVPANAAATAAPATSASAKANL